MDFRTEISLAPSQWSIVHTDQVLTLGSCFAQSIGGRFVENKFRAEVNPFGTTYNPLSIHKLLKYAAYQEFPAEHTFMENDGAVHNFDFHSSFSHPEKSMAITRIRDQVSAMHFFLRQCR